jgi:hypothetical protein
LLIRSFYGLNKRSRGITQESASASSYRPKI